ncbi:MAG: 50S ribosomal protein L10 [candidate division WOR-3 bacterium]|jgi:large subunit ribosomal protein L10
MISVSKQKKREIIDVAKSLISNSKGFYVIDYKGWNVSEINSLRRKLKEQNARMKVIKNTLFNLALKELNLDINEKLEGTNAFIFIQGDEIQPLKVLTEFIKETNKGGLKLGYINGVKYNKEQLEVLSKLPSTNELRAKVIGTINAPIYNLVFGLKALLNNLVFVLSQIKTKKEA